MRADMGKVLVERPRPGSRDGSRPRKGYRRLLRKELDEDTPRTRERMTARSGGTRWFNEHLAPLRRFINSNVGRPWNKVYAEICEHVDRGNVVQKHILTHLFDYVVTNVALIDGEPCDGNPGYRYGHPLRESDRRRQWYVCPKSRLLRRSRYVPRERRKSIQVPHRVRLNKREMCLKLNGQWELVNLRPLPGVNETRGYDVVLRRFVSHYWGGESEVVQLYGTTVYAVSRRHLSRLELLAMPIPIEWIK